LQIYSPKNNHEPGLLKGNLLDCNFFELSETGVNLIGYNFFDLTTTDEFFSLRHDVLEAWLEKLEDGEDKKDMSYQPAVHLERISLVHISCFRGYHVFFSFL
jgi:hypothetical protein